VRLIIGPIRVRISVKLVSEIGIGTVAAGVSKAHADHVTISGYDGGTGASPLTSIKHAGSPWEIGLAETHQILVLNNLRGRIAVQVDGGMRTGRDVVIGALLGADEFGFATAPLIVSGCIMMRKCHLNTCPVGVATQDPELRKRFTGQPEHIINYRFFVAEEMRRIMARLGYRTVSEMIGQSDRLEMRRALDHWKAQGLDFTRLLMKPKVGLEVAISNRETQDQGLDKSLDHELIKQAQPALQRGEPVAIETRVHNYNRTFGAMLSGRVAERYGPGFMEHDRRDRRYEPVSDRVVNYQEFVIPLTDAEVSTQAARCMDCGIPFCHQGCPVNNIIPDWNDLTYKGDWQLAIEVLHSTNNFPEFTGRICPAPCEAACTLNIGDAPVAIKTIECAIVDKSRSWTSRRSRRPRG